MISDFSFEYILVTNDVLCLKVVVSFDLRLRNEFKFWNRDSAALKRLLKCSYLNLRNFSNPHSFHNLRSEKATTLVQYYTTFLLLFLRLQKRLLTSEDLINFIILVPSDQVWSSRHERVTGNSSTILALRFIVNSFRLSWIRLL